MGPTEMTIVVDCVNLHALGRNQKQTLSLRIFKVTFSLARPQSKHDYAYDCTHVFVSRDHCNVADSTSSRGLVVVVCKELRATPLTING